MRIPQALLVLFLVVGCAAARPQMPVVAPVATHVSVEQMNLGDPPIDRDPDLCYHWWLAEANRVRSSPVLQLRALSNAYRYAAAATQCTGLGVAAARLLTRLTMGELPPEDVRVVWNSTHFLVRLVQACVPQEMMGEPVPPPSDGPSAPASNTF